MRVLPALVAAALLTTPLSAQPAGSLSIAPLLAGTAGQWSGELQYRDYQSDRWEGLPMQVSIAAQPDGVTQVRLASFDDGPQTGIVYITSTAIVDPATGQQSYALFRKGRPVDSGTARLTMPEPAKDVLHWRIIATEIRRDGDSMAEVRETTTRNGDRLETLKEVNPLDDGKDEWLPRNRTVLARAGS